jgi:hypothetical protein
MEAAEADLDLRQVFGRSVQQAWEPIERDSHNATIFEFDPERVIVEANRYWSRRNIHPKPA